MSERSLKVTVSFESRPDGGLRVWSNDLPGLVLSHPNVDDVLDDVKTALETILSHRLQAKIIVTPLVDVREALEDNGIVPPRVPPTGQKEYVAYYQ